LGVPFTVPVLQVLEPAAGVRIGVVSVDIGPDWLSVAHTATGIPEVEMAWGIEIDGRMCYGIGDGWSGTKEWMSGVATAGGRFRPGSTLRLIVGLVDGRGGADLQVTPTSTGGAPSRLTLGAGVETSGDRDAGGPRPLDPERLRTRAANDPHDLLPEAIVPLAGAVALDGADLTVLALERWRNRFVVRYHWAKWDPFPADDVPSTPLDGPATASDDRGGIYECDRAGGSGDEGVGWIVKQQFFPSLDDAATRLTITVPSHLNKSPLLSLDVDLPG
jgi:hypothetical protein